MVSRLIMAVKRGKERFAIPCEVKMDHQRRLSAATASFIECLRELNSNRGVIPRDRYEMAVARCEELRVSVEAAQDALDQHVAEHGC